jgi:integrase
LTSPILSNPKPVTNRGSKTDQERAGATIAIARGDVACPANALREWLDAAGIESGPIFRPIDKGGTVRTSRLTDRSVANIVKAYAARAGFDASTFSGHSLRAGFLTSAAGKGASIFKMMDVSRHKSVDTLRGATSAMRSYSRIMRGQVCCEAGGGMNG